MNSQAALREFLFRGLMVESEAAGFQAAGIQVGADVGQAEERSLSEALSPFGVARRNRALEMARLYSVLHCFENEVRTLIRETLEEKEGLDWATKLPTKVLKYAEARQKEAASDTWLEGEKDDLLGFVDFGHLATIIIEKWVHFEDVMPSQHWLKQRMDEIEKARHSIAHNRMLCLRSFSAFTCISRTGIAPSGSDTAGHAPSSPDILLSVIRQRRDHGADAVDRDGALHTVPRCRHYGEPPTALQAY